jgi:hypothetical protein
MAKSQFRSISKVVMMNITPKMVIQMAREVRNMEKKKLESLNKVIPIRCIPSMVNYSKMI